MSNKRLFQVLDEMNVNDEANKTAKLGCCYDMVDARTAKGGGHVTMGVPAEAVSKIFLGEYQPILLLLDKKEYHRLNDQPIAITEAEQRADRYEKALKDIRRWELATGKKIRVKHLDILKDVMRVVNNALTPKTGSDE